MNTICQIFSTAAEEETLEIPQKKWHLDQNPQKQYIKPKELQTLGLTHNVCKISMIDIFQKKRDRAGTCSPSHWEMETYGLGYQGKPC